MGTIRYPATPYHQLKRQQLLQLAEALEEQRDRALREVERRRAIVAAVEALHQPEHGGMGYLPSGDYGTFPGPVCSTCGTPDEYGVPWPCPTRAALDGGAGDGS